MLIKHIKQLPNVVLKGFNFNIIHITITVITNIVIITINPFHDLYFQSTLQKVKTTTINLASKGIK